MQGVLLGGGEQSKEGKRSMKVPPARPTTTLACVSSVMNTRTILNHDSSSPLLSMPSYLDDHRKILSRPGRLGLTQWERKGFAVEPWLPIIAILKFRQLLNYVPNVITI